MVALLQLMATLATVAFVCQLVKAQPLVQQAAHGHLISTITRQRLRSRLMTCQVFAVEVWTTLQFFKAARGVTLQQLQVAQSQQSAETLTAEQLQFMG